MVLIGREILVALVHETCVGTRTRTEFASRTRKV